MEYQDTSLLDWYVYTFEFDQLGFAVGQNILTARVEVEADANFIHMSTSGFASIGGAPQTEDTLVVPLVSFQITDTGSGRQLLNGETAWGAIVGNAKLPYILPIDRKYKASSVIRLTATNFSVGTTYDLKVSFSGVKDFGQVQQRA